MSHKPHSLPDGFYESTPVSIGQQHLPALLGLPVGAQGLVIFAHDNGSGRLSPRNNFVAERLRREKFGTLLLDLLTPMEERDRRNEFDVQLLAHRLVLANEWAHSDERTRSLPVGYFGANTGAAAALVASVGLPDRRVSAVVSRGGRPDLAADMLTEVRTPTLLIVGGLDEEIIEFNNAALRTLDATAELVIVPGAGHLFEEAGALDAVAAHAIRWFDTHLKRVSPAS